ncbi:HSP20-like chaperone [Phakopsora pachyrhizi]|uniref:HSP20-like chaperone n=1 Tax=Phakopsora pachyrhizi TaxID=170000 RepID=A0AAV0BKV6_PHAPC|nr:HSP20-like chaperone [Phakopsora pachyrhizi]CAH7687857.1 HSP20-like chaperone [Phakopsora pachyrhizi]
MSYSFFVPNQWDDFENLFDRLVTDRYGPPANSGKGESNNKSLTRATGSSIVSQVHRPKMDVVETEDSFLVTTELPGAKKEDIAIDLQNGRLTISGQTKSSSEHTQGSVRVSERSFGSFARTIAVPQSVTHDQIKASFTDGVLQVTVPKVKPGSKESQSIPIS